ncbi:MAG: circadian clock protein KaiB [Solirubrobacteraceae bacterium]|jgi:circadian clock protein KaiB|nr:circadian clock protein KaiB [Solirubrobacteraceae bacterium]
MTQDLPPRADVRFERVPGPLSSEPYMLTLFVSGASEASARAIANVREICDAHATGEYELGIVDLNQEAQSAGGEHVLATPTLVRDRPLPTRMLVGDMSDQARVLLLLDMAAVSQATVRGAS